MRRGGHRVHQSASLLGIGIPSSEVTFLDIDDGIGAAKLERQTLVVAQQLSMFGRERMGRRLTGFSAS